MLDTNLTEKLTVTASMSDDLLRKVYCVLGLPIDEIDMQAVLKNIQEAAANTTFMFVSTPNLNFLVHSQRDAEFRESLLLSDLCPADGMPIVWIARLMGIPIKTRVAGSDIFESLKTHSHRPLKIVLFGATETVAAAASNKLNNGIGGLSCVGWVCPGFGSVEQLSHDKFIDKINSFNADFLVAALGAKKGQLWLFRNYRRLSIPVRSHLGATINFEAGTIRRAPSFVQKFGFEWLWRIKQEPYLWKRYWSDARVALGLLVFRVLPLVLWTQWLRIKYRHCAQELVIQQILDDKSVTVGLSGHATAQHLDKIIPAFRRAIAANKPTVLDFSGTRFLDARFLGCILMLRKKLNSSGFKLTVIGLSKEVKKLFLWNGLEFLLI
jgi:N-acetylglucosaminyldiphosphoundecaprenol N-acetyl-beta-D-mannosaminyltransferase